MGGLKTHFPPGPKSRQVKSKSRGDAKAVWGRQSVNKFVSKPYEADCIYIFSLEFMLEWKGRT